ncbi:MULTISPECIES: outer membrane beta-barrel protein [Rhodopseudomonas]|uniref:Membrane protein n=1 Tax=Rhodopseudomonas palustris TaxID=1076 RepID=A0A0D7E0I8_RHOPL|nr:MULTISPECIES: outer membrane beta-barrel protein [Rhodopseudomonas]KIZ34026.1 membrane protein [Rhodopseudomonas palustris]MDF3813118.1 outer membrane beta-barrel protein [Rhodopseudomonas sp. BAL398]WOK20812.1 outer membrane beta-barrel protein [Rhodopseudomonas sp. BAL398]
MKRILAGAMLVGTAVSAQAADMAVKAPYLKAPMAAIYDWTGFYIGVNAGVGIGRNRTSHSLNNDTLYINPQGGFGGGQIGYNWQTNSMLGPIVYGVEADFQGAGLSDDSVSVLPATQYNQKSDWFGTVRGRIGLATGPVLSYFTGGYAYGNLKTTVNEGGIAAFSDSKTVTGWTIGSGVEAALGGNWTGKIEYLYLDMGNKTDTFGPGVQVLNSKIRENIFRVGLNYRIGGNNAGYIAPVAANWTGWYLGGNFGSGTGRDRSSIAGINEQFNLSPDGVNGGVQAGYNWQMANWVYGLETDIQASNQKDDKTVVALGLASFNAKLPWFGTVRGRLGYSVGQTLFYATGGFAYGEVKTKVSVLGQTAEVSNTQTGYAVGGGIETPFNPLGLFGPNWTSKTEYLYVDLGSQTQGSGTTTFTTDVTEHVLRTGLNYHFNSPTVARY